MRKMKVFNGIILFFIVFFGIAYGAGPYDEIISDLEQLQKELGFIYGRYVQGTPEEKKKACEQVVKVFDKIEEKLKTIVVKDEKNPIAIDKKTLQEKIASFGRSKQNLGGECKDFVDSVFGNTIFEAYLGNSEDTVRGLRGLLKILIDHLKMNNKEELIASNTAE